MLSHQELTISQHLKDYINLVDANKQLKVARELLSFAEKNYATLIKQRARERYILKRDAELAKRPQAQFMAKLILKAGDIIKISGTRDYSGMREVISLIGTKVTCHKLIGNHGWGGWLPSAATLEKYIHSGIKTKNDLSKVTHIARDGKWHEFNVTK